MTTQILNSCLIITEYSLKLLLIMYISNERKIRIDNKVSLIWEWWEVTIVDWTYDKQFMNAAEYLNSVATGGWR